MCLLGEEVIARGDEGKGKKVMVDKDMKKAADNMCQGRRDSWGSVAQ